MRRGRGRGFEYVDEDGRGVDNSAVIERIAELVIPPAWRDVWICPDPLGHLQATGVDAAARKQYRYHDLWRGRRDQQKFDSMVHFAVAVAAMRRRVKRDLAGRRAHARTRPGLRHAAAGLGFFRIGSEEYAEHHDSYGLATMLKRHVRVEREEIVFAYVAKNGRRRVQAIADPAVCDVIRALKRRRGGGPELLAHRNGRRWVDVPSDDITAVPQGRAARAFSAKDFRTWNATVLPAVALAAGGAEAETKTARKRAINASVKAVFAYLGNTPAVCRVSYIDPRVFDRYHPGWTIGAAIDREGGDADLFDERTRMRIEAAVLDLIGDQESPALARVPQ